MKGKRPLRRRSYILVLWAETGLLPESPDVWRVSLEDTQTAQRYGFKNLTELFRFLERQTAALRDSPPHNAPRASAKGEQR